MKDFGNFCKLDIKKLFNMFHTKEKCKRESEGESKRNENVNKQKEESKRTKLMSMQLTVYFCSRK